jgi:hypothetical protein
VLAEPEEGKASFCRPPDMSELLVNSLWKPMFEPSPDAMLGLADQY